MILAEARKLNERENKKIKRRKSVYKKQIIYISKKHLF